MESLRASYTERKTACLAFISGATGLTMILLSCKVQPSGR